MKLFLPNFKLRIFGEDCEKYASTWSLIYDCDSKQERMQLYAHKIQPIPSQRYAANLPCINSHSESCRLTPAYADQPTMTQYAQPLKFVFHVSSSPIAVVSFPLNARVALRLCIVFVHLICHDHHPKQEYASHQLERPCRCPTLACKFITLATVLQAIQLTPRTTNRRPTHICYAAPNTPMYSHLPQYLLALLHRDCNFRSRSPTVPTTLSKLR
jgi:hypothetical protein